MRVLRIVAAAALAVVPFSSSWAQTAINLKTLQVLAPFSALLGSSPGKAALAANLFITGDIQNRMSGQPGLQDFAGQQAQALQDATITGNGYRLVDGLGSRLGEAYRSLTHVSKPAAGKMAPETTNISGNVAILFGYAAGLTGADSNAAKYFFADAMMGGKSGSAPVSPAAAAIMQAVHGQIDVYGKGYGDPAGSPKADPFGDSRPFQTEARTTKFNDPDFFGDPSSNQDYLTGPAQNLLKSPAFPSGHTTYGFTESLLFAVMVPERFTQMVARGAEYGNSRIILGAHYAMDVIGGRTVALYDVAHLLANDPAYLGQKEGKAVPVKDFQAAVGAARADLRAALGKACGAGLKACAGEDTGRFADAAKDAAFTESTQTYGLPVVYPAMAGRTEDVGRLAPEAGYILTTAFPKLSLRQADAILTKTEGPGGGFLDDGSKFGVYSRLDLYKAGLQAEARR